MNGKISALIALASVLAGAAWAEAPTRSLLPGTRPATTGETVAVIRPVERPDGAAHVAAAVGENSPVPAPAPAAAAPEAAPPPIAEGDTDPASEARIAAEAEEVTEGRAPVVARLAVSPFPVPRPRVVIRQAPPPEPEASPAPSTLPAPEVVVTAAVTPPSRVTVRPPAPRPRGLLAAIFRAPDRPAKYPAEGSVCGDPAIRGQAVPPIPAKLRGCGVDKPVRITAVDGVALSTPATVSCGTARALRSWVTNAVKPTVGRIGGGLAGLRVAASYSCRTRNNVPGAKISEHGRGKAIDISAIQLKDGTLVTVLQGWRSKTFSPILKAIHARACGPFGTVLGPNADRHHRDHFHFDVAKHGYGPYCR